MKPHQAPPHLGDLLPIARIDEFLGSRKPQLQRVQKQQPHQKKPVETLDQHPGEVRIDVLNLDARHLHEVVKLDGHVRIANENEIENVSQIENLE